MAADLMLDEMMPKGYRGRELRIENEGLEVGFLYFNQQWLHSVSNQIRIS